MEHLVRCRHMFAARKIGNCRPRPDRDQYIFRRHRPAAGQRDLVRPGQLGAFEDDLNPMIFKRLCIGIVEPVDVLEDMIAQSRPVKFGIVPSPAEILSVFQLFRKMRAIDQQLLRHAPADNTGPAHAIFFGDSDFCAIGCRNPRCPRSSGTCSDNEQVIIIFSHL